MYTGPSITSSSPPAIVAAVRSRVANAGDWAGDAAMCWGVSANVIPIPINSSVTSVKKIQP